MNTQASTAITLHNMTFRLKILFILLAIASSWLLYQPYTRMMDGMPLPNMRVGYNEWAWRDIYNKNKTVPPAHTPHPWFYNFGYALKITPDYHLERLNPIYHYREENTKNQNGEIAWQPYHWQIDPLNDPLGSITFYEQGFGYRYYHKSSQSVKEFLFRFKDGLFYQELAEDNLGTLLHHYDFNDTTTLRLPDGIDPNRPLRPYPTYTPGKSDGPYFLTIKGIHSDGDLGITFYRLATIPKHRHHVVIDTIDAYYFIDSKKPEIRLLTQAEVDAMQLVFFHPQSGADGHLEGISVWLAYTPFWLFLWLALFFLYFAVRGVVVKKRLGDQLPSLAPWQIVFLKQTETISVISVLISIPILIVSYIVLSRIVGKFQLHFLHNPLFFTLLNVALQSLVIRLLHARSLRRGKRVKPPFKTIKATFDPIMLYHIKSAFYLAKSPYPWIFFSTVVGIALFHLLTALSGSFDLVLSILGAFFAFPVLLLWFVTSPIHLRYLMKVYYLTQQEQAEPSPPE